MKKIKYLIFLLVLGAFLVVPNAKSSIKPYYGGEVINFKGNIYIGTTNNRAFELFKFENNNLARVAIIQPDDIKYDTFFDLLFNAENNRLYVYLVSGKYFYKYDITDHNNYRLIKKTKDNSGDYFYALEKTNGRMATIGTKGVKLWNYDMLNITDYNVHSTFAENIIITADGNFILKVLKDQFRIIDTGYRVLAKEVGITLREDHARKPSFDMASGAAYVVDDQYFKKIHLDGRVEQFRHISKLGYDAAQINGSPYVYFSDGVGIVKLNKSDLKPINWRFTANDGPGNGWAMGLRVFSSKSGEKVVLFNGSSIMVIDDNMRLLAYYSASEHELPKKLPADIKLDRYHGFSHDVLYVYGNNFSPNEWVNIVFLEENWEVQANANGVFSTKMRIPDAVYKNRRYDVKATGQDSGQTYSVSFEVLE